MAFNVVNKRLYAGILYFYLNYSTWFEPSWRSTYKPPPDPHGGFFMGGIPATPRRPSRRVEPGGEVGYEKRPGNPLLRAAGGAAGSGDHGNSPKS